MNKIIFEKGRSEFLKWVGDTLEYSRVTHPNDTTKALNLFAFSLCAMFDGVSNCEVDAVYQGEDIGGRLHEEFHQYQLKEAGYEDVSNLDSEYRKLQTQRVEAETVDVKVGNLSITNEKIGTKIGVGTVIMYDGMEVTNVRSFTLHVQADEPITATVERFV